MSQTNSFFIKSLHLEDLLTSLLTKFGTIHLHGQGSWLTQHEKIPHSGVINSLRKAKPHQKVAVDGRLGDG